MQHSEHRDKQGGVHTSQKHSEAKQASPQTRTNGQEPSGVTALFHWYFRSLGVRRAQALAAPAPLRAGLRHFQGQVMDDIGVRAAGWPDSHSDSGRGPDTRLPRATLQVTEACLREGDSQLHPECAQKVLALPPVSERLLSGAVGAAGLLPTRGQGSHAQGSPRLKQRVLACWESRPARWPGPDSQANWPMCRALQERGRSPPHTPP